MCWIGKKTSHFYRHGIFGNLFPERDEERRSILTGTVRAVVSDIPGIPGFAKCKLITKYKMVSAHGV